MKGLPGILIVVGIALLAYWGYEYSQNSSSASIGELELSVRESTSPILAILGGVSLLAGAVMSFKKKG